MISSTSNTDNVFRPDLPPPAGPNGSRPARPGPDQFSSDGTACLRAALDRQPAIRPEVVARGRELAADPGYPPAAVIASVARQILASPDLSEN